SSKRRSGVGRHPPVPAFLPLHRFCLSIIRLRNKLARASPAKRGCAKQDGGQGGIAKTRFGVFSSSGKSPRIASLHSAPKTPSAFCRTWVRSPRPITHQQMSPRLGAHLLVADRVGFEPTRRFPVHTLSKRAPSATRPPVRTKR